MRRLRALALILLAFPLVVPAPEAHAQDEPSVRLTLLSQTPWNSPCDGSTASAMCERFGDANGRTLELRFRAENLSDEDVDRLSIGVTLYGRITSRTAFEQSLTTDPSVVLDAETLPREAALAAGDTRDFDVEFALDSAGISTTQSGVYPMKVELRSGFTPLAALRTPMIFLVRQPELPLALSWTFVVDQPIGIDADGIFTSPDLETALEPDGVLAAQIRALSSVADDDGRAVDVAISPPVLSQLEQMRDGYRIVRDGETISVPAGAEPAEAAATALEQLRSIANARNVRVSPLPFSMPELPSLIDGGLDGDVSVQLQRGAEAVREAIGGPLAPGVLRPPGAALDDDTLSALEAAGVQTLVVGPSTVATDGADPLGFAGPPTAALDGGALDAIVPDPAVMTLLGSGVVTEDPVLGAQAMLGEMATIWQEQPGVERGIALVLSEDLSVPSAFYPAFARGVDGAPWLDPMHAEEFIDAFPPSAATPLIGPQPRSFAPGYIAQVRQARRRVDTLRSMLAAPSEDPDRYDSLLLLAESRQYLSDPTTGLAFITAVQDEVGAVFDGVTVDAPSVITLTSSNGSTIPVTISNDSEQRLRLEVELDAGARFRETPSTEVELAAGGSELVTFAVDVRSTGRFTVALKVLAPGGRLIEARTITVRSTVYNRIALVITFAAALVLVGLWVRRLVARRAR
jgi:hypothetical protein